MSDPNDNAALLALAHRLTTEVSSYNAGLTPASSLATISLGAAEKLRTLATRPAVDTPAVGGVVEPSPEWPSDGWLPMESAPRDGTLLRLLVDFTEHATEDMDRAPTIGANNRDHDGEEVWKFAGWDWQQDRFTQAEGTPIGWLPIVGTTPPPTPDAHSCPNCLGIAPETCVIDRTPDAAPSGQGVGEDVVRKALTAARDWFEAQAKVISKGNGSSWDLLQVREQRDLCDAALAAAGVSGVVIHDAMVERACASFRKTLLMEIRHESVRAALQAALTRGAARDGGEEA